MFVFAAEQWPWIMLNFVKLAVPLLLWPYISALSVSVNLWFWQMPCYRGWGRTPQSSPSKQDACDVTRLVLYTGSPQNRPWKVNKLNQTLGESFSYKEYLNHSQIYKWKSFPIPAPPPPKWFVPFNLTIETLWLHVWGKGVNSGLDF